VALALADPPAPVQVNVKPVLALSAAVIFDPLVLSEPLQPPEAVQVVALVELQLRVALPPAEMVIGVALKVTVGAGVDEPLLPPPPPPPQAASARDPAARPATKIARPFVSAKGKRGDLKRNDRLCVICMGVLYMATSTGARV
jgi:hypothetical protein